MAQRTHVPRFGSWDKDNIPYTAYFENARKEKAGARTMNPNDPEENPDVMALVYKAAGGSKEGNAHFSMGKSPFRHSAKSSRESVSRRKSDSNMGFSSADGSRDNIAANQPRDNTFQRAASVPKFGSWDETDPKSSEGFTVVFNRVKEEKQIASATFPPVSSYAHTQLNQTTSSRRSKLCCCCWFCRTSE